MRKSKILVVDDDPKISSLVRVLLSRMGNYEVREENRSFAALNTAQDYRPDLIILDIDMPGKDGGDVATELNNDSQFRSTPVLFLSSLVTPLEAGIRNGTHYLSKPVRPQVLLNTVRALLDAQAA